MINSFEVLKNISYVRTGGSKEELACAEYLVDCFKEAGVCAAIEPFKVQAGEVKACLKVVAPFEKEIACLGYVGCANCKDLRAELYVLRNVDDIYELAMCKGKIVCIEGYLRHWTYKDIVEAGAVGVVVAGGQYITEDRDIDQRELREPLREFGVLPIVQINVKDLIDLVHSGAKELCLNVSGELREGESWNVVARIEGEVAQSVIFTAHYDSTSLSRGAWDNGTGAVTVLKLAEYFSAHRPHFSCIFVLCGCEERGLLGSHAYVKDHESELRDIGLCINVDMVGSVIGNLVGCVTAEEALAGYLTCFARIYGRGIHVYRDVYSSDSTPFADAGVPAMSFGSDCRSTPIHCRYDVLDIVDETVLNEDIEFICRFSEGIVNGAVMAVKRVMPEDMKEKLDYYLRRKRKEG